MNIGSALGRPNMVRDVEMSDILFKLISAVNACSFQASYKTTHTRGLNQKRLNAAKFSQ